MIFSSLFFLYAFLPLCLITYRIPNNLRAKNLLLLVFSLFFYAWGEPIGILQLLLSGATVYFFSLGIEKYRHIARMKKISLGLAVVSALIPLFLFKYSGFFIENINRVTGLGMPLPSFTMPIGISFYTFQIISYSVDLYRGQCEVQRSLPKFWLYQSLFPQLIAGPIVRYSDVETELNKRRATTDDLVQGMTRFLIGLAKKVLIANQVGQIVELTLVNPDRLNSLSALLGILAFTFQIYYDFSAYSDMAIGLGMLFGFHFKENFNYPYMANSATDFWRRWHMSLGSFFRDYVYIPLGGNRRHHYRNIIVVWFLTGFWHGASWNFIFWGLFFGVLLLLENRWLLAWFDRKPPIIRYLYMIPVLLMGWALFYYVDLSQFGVFISRLFSFSSSLESRIMLRQNLPLLIIALIGSFPIAHLIKRRAPQLRTLNFIKSPTYVMIHIVGLGLLLLLSTASLLGDSFNPFLYFRF